HPAVMFHQLKAELRNNRSKWPNRSTSLIGLTGFSTIPFVPHPPERVMHLPPHPPAPSPTQSGCPSFAGGRGASTTAMSLSPSTVERDGMPKRSDESRGRGNLELAPIQWRKS